MEARTGDIVEATVDMVRADHMILILLKYMSHDEVRDALDSNEIGPRFKEDEE